MSGSLAPAAPRVAPQPQPLRTPRLGGDSPPPSDAALRRAAQQFEAQALGLLLQPVFATVDSARGAFGGGAAEAQWRPMLVEAYAAAASRAGGLGLSDAVFRELRRQADRARPSPSPSRSSVP